MNSGLAGQRVLVTASSAGIGYGAAEAFLKEGARVVINSSNQEKLDAAKARLAPLGEVHSVVGNLALKSDIEKIVQQAVGHSWRHRHPDLRHGVSEARKVLGIRLRRLEGGGRPACGQPCLHRQARRRPDDQGRHQGKDGLPVLLRHQGAEPEHRTLQRLPGLGALTSPDARKGPRSQGNPRKRPPPGVHQDRKDRPARAGCGEDGVG